MRYEGPVLSEVGGRDEGIFPYAADAPDNTHKIAERCNVDIESGVTKLPQFDAGGYTVGISENALL